MLRDVQKKVDFELVFLGYFHLVVDAVFFFSSSLLIQIHAAIQC